MQQFDEARGNQRCGLHGLGDHGVSRRQRRRYLILACSNRQRKIPWTDAGEYAAPVQGQFVRSRRWDLPAVPVPQEDCSPAPRSVIAAEIHGFAHLGNGVRQGADTRLPEPEAGGNPRRLATRADRTFSSKAARCSPPATSARQAAPAAPNRTLRVISAGGGIARAARRSRRSAGLVTTCVFPGNKIAIDDGRRQQRLRCGRARRDIPASPQASCGLPRSMPRELRRSAYSAPGKGRRGCA